MRILRLSKFYVYTVYFIYSANFNKIYIGQTDNIDRRIFEHNNGLLSSNTKRYKPWQIVYTEELPTISEALISEKQLKSQKGKNSFGN